jgi:ubiquitin-protein ligase
MYKGGRFNFSFAINQNFPHDPPKVKCTQKIYHPNIDLEGNVCLNILREDWKPVLNLNAVIVGLQVRDSPQVLYNTANICANSSYSSNPTPPTLSTKMQPKTYGRTARDSRGTSGQLWAVARCGVCLLRRF